MVNKTAANKSDVFQRLIGLETEYALYAPAPAGRPRLNRHAIYSALVAALRTKQIALRCNADARVPGFFVGWKPYAIESPRAR